MVYSRELLDEIKRRISIIELAGKYIKDLVRKSNNLWVGTCPKHEDRFPSLTFYEKENSWACYSCHKDKNDEDYKGSDVIAFYQWITGKNFYLSVRELAELADIEIKNDVNYHMYVNTKREAIRYAASLTENKKKYLYLRGLDDEDIEKWLIGYSSYNDRYTFPLIDKFNRIIGFTKRLRQYKDGLPKYINSKNSVIFNKSNYFYGINNIDTFNKNIIITEGVFDVILAQKYGVNNVLACLGTAFTDKHIEYIKYNNFIPTFILDGDEAGKNATKKNISLLSKNNILSKVLILPDNKDLADIANEYKYNLSKYIEDNTKHYLLYIMSDLITKYDSAILQAQSDLLLAARDILDNVTNHERDVVKQFLYNKANIII